MAGIEDLFNLVRLHVERCMAQYSPQSRVGTVSSYDKKTHSVKVMLQPESRESNWIPIAVQHAGDGYGILIGPEIGDQMEISFHHNDPSTARATGRYHSEKDRPPQVESGEVLVKHKSGTSIFIDKDGNLRIEASGDMRIKAGGNMLINTGGDLHLNGGDDGKAPSPNYEGAPTS